MHLAAGILITLVVGYFSTPLVGAYAAIIAGGLKEYYDRQNPEKHTYDGWDAYATVLGAIPGSLVLTYQAKILAFVLPYLSIFYS